MHEALAEMWVLLLCKEMRLGMAEAKIIYCPNCGRRVCQWDGKATINPMGTCKKCNKLVVYDVEKDEIRVKKPLYRQTSSGKTIF